MWSGEASPCPAVKMQMNFFHSVNIRMVLVLEWAVQRVSNMFPDWATSFFASCSGIRNFALFFKHSGLLYVFKTW